MYGNVNIIRVSSNYRIVTAVQNNALKLIHLMKFIKFSIDVDKQYYPVMVFWVFYTLLCNEFAPTCQMNVLPSFAGWVNSVPVGAEVRGGMCQLWGMYNWKPFVTLMWHCRWHSCLCDWVTTLADNVKNRSTGWVYSMDDMQLNIVIPANLLVAELRA
jgi:hypothetical protein